MNRNYKGFSINELIVVIAIIVIVAAVVVPLFSTQIIKTKISNTRYDVDKYVKDLLIYANTNGSFQDENSTIWQCYDLNENYVNRVCLIRDSETVTNVEVYLTDNVVPDVSDPYYMYTLEI